MANIAPITAARQAIIGALTSADFFATGWTIRGDRLLDSMGQDGNYVGVYPMHEEADHRTAIQKNMTIAVQIFGRYEDDLDEAQRVDPAVIEGRVQAAVDAIHDGAAGDPVWFMNVVYVDYPDDPTGNKTRAVLEVLAYSYNNAFLSETQV